MLPKKVFRDVDQMTLSVKSEDGYVFIDTENSMLAFTPKTAERLAKLLAEYASKAKGKG